MKETVFLFDLDSTITKAEILPEIAKKIGKQEEMQKLTEECMIKDIPFEEGFRKRMNMLSDIPVGSINEVILDIALNEKLVEFIRKNKEQSYIVSGSVDIFIEKLMNKLGMENNYFSSKANVKNDKIADIYCIIDKGKIVAKFKEDYRVIAVGDGSNDREMLKNSDIGIAFGGVRKIAPSLLEVADYKVYSEDELCEVLSKVS